MAVKGMFYIYRTTNLINGKTYIGQHKRRPGRYFGSGLLLKNAIKKYGKENFKVEILYDNIQLKETADSVEMFAIAKERKIGKAEYNIANGGQGGRILNDEDEKRRLEKAHQTYIENLKSGKTKVKGHKISEEQKQHIKETWHQFHDSSTNHNSTGRFCRKDGTCNMSKLSKGSTGMHWFNNGVENKMAFECPDGFWPGRVYKNKPTGRPKSAKKEENKDASN